MHAGGSSTCVLFPSLAKVDGIVSLCIPFSFFLVLLRVAMNRNVRRSRFQVSSLQKENLDLRTVAKYGRDDVWPQLQCQKRILLAVARGWQPASNADFREWRTACPQTEQTDTETCIVEGWVVHQKTVGAVRVASGVAIWCGRLMC